MIDTHCHLLPGLDDGPSNTAEAVRLARSLVAAGVQTVVCTPHYSRRFPTEHDVVGDRVRELDTTLTTCSISVELRVAAEVSPAFALLAPLHELRLRSIAGRFVIVEVQPNTPATFFETASSRLAEGELVAVFAHPERCRAAQRRPRLLAVAHDEGALLQVVAPSLTGGWGREIAALAWMLLRDGRAELLGSDAHGRGRGGTEFEKALAVARTRLGEDRVHHVVARTPALLLEGVHPREARRPA
jgi:protein-tyrosine phosphatase